MPRNKITDLNDHLFAQLERLSDESLDGELLNTEIERAKAISLVASNIVGAAKITIEVAKLVGTGKVYHNELPSIFTDHKKID